MTPQAFIEFVTRYVEDQEQENLDLQREANALRKETAALRNDIETLRKNPVVESGETSKAPVCLLPTITWQMVNEARERADAIPYRPSFAQQIAAALNQIIIKYYVKVSAQQFTPQTVEEVSRQAAFLTQRKCAAIVRERMQHEHPYSYLYTVLETLAKRLESELYQHVTFDSREEKGDL